MDLNVWCIFAILLVTASAARFDQGPQRFYESSSAPPQREQNTGDREVVLYLTPSQIKALEAGGAVVRSQEPDNDSELEGAQQENEDQPDEGVEEDQEEEQGQDENEAEEQEQQEEPEQAEQPEQEQEIAEELQVQDLDFEEIFRILNEEQIEQEEAKTEPALNVPQVTEETSEEEREIPPRFQVRLQQQQQQRLQQQKQQIRQENLLPPAEKKARSKIYSAIRYQQRNEQPQIQQQDARQNANQQEEPQTEAPSPLKRYKLVPYEIEEQSEEPAQEQQEEEQVQEDQEEQQEQEEQQQAEEQTAEEEENQDRLNALLTPLLTPERLADVISQRKSKLFKNEIELQTILNELKQSPKHNDQKYAIEIERFRANLEKQNTLSKAEAIAKTAPQLIKKEIQKRRPSKNAKQAKVSVPSVRNREPQRQQTPRPQPVLADNVRPVPFPIVRKQKNVVERPVPVGAEKRVPNTVTRNAYVKVNKPYLVQRNAPAQVRKAISVEIPTRKPQKVTILRHVWEH